MDAQVGAYLVATAQLPFRVSATRGDMRGGDRALLIAETRPSYFLPHVVSTAVRTHPGWGLYVVGTPEVHALLESQCENYGDVTRVTLDAGRMTVSQYSRLMMSPQLWDLVREEHVLVFQSDCVLVRGCADEMLHYDFVGAVCGSMHPQEFIMNGGLSLRRRSAMLRAIALIRQHHPKLLDEAEDIALCTVMRAHASEFTLPALETCLEFAIESVGDPHTAVGLHGVDKYYAPASLVARLLQSASSAS